MTNVVNNTVVVNVSRKKGNVIGSAVHLDRESAQWFFLLFALNGNPFFDLHRCCCTDNAINQTDSLTTVGSYCLFSILELIEFFENRDGDDYLVFFEVKN